ncbi:MAG: metallophosphoesterase [Acidobacteriia bacterium]|nr:metallophosphoesterase [Terriglobia bacterium]
MAIVVFIVVALAILYFSHYFLYGSIVHFFGVSGTARRAVLALVLFFLPTSFIAVEILARRTTNRLFGMLFFSSSLWLGVGLTLMVFFMLAWAAWGATKLLAHSPTPLVYGVAAVVLAGLYSAYGVWNAYHPRTREIVVGIKNLPPAWRGKRIVQLSDVHLGHILGAEFLRRLVDETNAQNPAVVFITGDLFDGADGRLDDLIRPLDDLRAPAYFITGNHETYLGVDRAYAALRRTRTRILADEMVVIDGLQVIGIGYPERGFSKDIGRVIGTLTGFDPQKPSICLYHNPTGIEQAKAAGINLQLSGHTHQGQLFPIQIISRLIYGKYYNGLHVEGDCTIYTSSGAGTWGPTMRTGNHPEIAVIRLE